MSFSDSFDSEVENPSLDENLGASFGIKVMFDAEYTREVIEDDDGRAVKKNNVFSWMFENSVQGLPRL